MQRNGNRVINIIHRSILLAARRLGTAQWVPLRARRGVIKRCFPIARAPAETFNISFRGNIIAVSLDDFIDNRIFFYNEYENAELDFIKYSALMYGSSCALDVGANSGIHTLEMSRVFRSVKSFEPFKQVREKLSQRLEVNSINNVFVASYALGSNSGVLDYYANPASINKGMGSFDHNHDLSSIKINSFEIKTGDEALSGQPSVDFVKIDVEGWEPEVLLGLIETIRRCLPVLMFELTKSSIAKPSFRTAISELKAEEYRFYEIEKSKKPVSSRTFSLLEVADFTPRTEGTNYAAIPSARQLVTAC